MITTLHTNGQGLWSREQRAIDVAKIDFRVTDTSEGDRWGFLNVYFDESQWNCEEDGLIYTDPQFESELLDALRKHFTGFEFTEKDVRYSEQGMQGSNFVNFDISRKFATFIVENFEHEDWVERSFFDFESLGILGY